MADPATPPQQQQQEHKTEEDEEEEEPVYVPYSARPEWSDVVPVPQDDGPGGIVTIAYSDQYVDTMDYFRAVVQLDERSPRALELTADAIGLNSANYTAWYYRRLCLEAVTGGDKTHPLWEEEMAFIVRTVLQSPKNYQIWFHRQKVVEKTGDFSRELGDLDKVLQLDAKNYHAWTHRQWVLKTLETQEDWNWEQEIAFIDLLLVEDLRNNSAWNHRWHILHRRETQGLSDKTVQQEIDYTFKAIQQIPSNESAWTYLRGILRGRDDAVVSAALQTAQALVDPTRANVPQLTFVANVSAALGRKDLLLETCKELEAVDGVRAEFWQRFAQR